MSGRARTSRALLTLSVALALVAGPAIPGAGVPPSTSVDRVPLDRWEQRDDHAVAVIEVTDVVSVASDLALDVDVEVRARRDGAWAPWAAFLRPGEHLPDPDRTEYEAVVTSISDPVWVAGTDLVEIRVPAGAGRPDVLHVVRATGGDGLAWSPPEGSAAGAAEALSVWPPMVPRSVWDPEGECRPKGPPDYAPRVERAYVHHTAIFADYRPDEADDAVRAMCVFHVEGRGFDDLGYNFLVDRYGRIYQGRAGGILRPVVGAHASGFNTGSVGIALIGNFDEGGVPPAALDALDRLTAWLFEWHDIDPYAVTPHVSTGGATTPHPAGEAVLLPTIVGHRQTATNTSCPGDHLFEHVNGADPASHRIARRLRDTGVDVGGAVHPPAQPQVVPSAPDAVAPSTPVVGQVLERVVAAVRTLAARRLDERLVPRLMP